MDSIQTHSVHLCGARSTEQLHGNYFNSPPARPILVPCVHSTRQGSGLNRELLILSHKALPGRHWALFQYLIWKVLGMAVTESRGFYDRKLSNKQTQIGFWWVFLLEFRVPKEQWGHVPTFESTNGRLEGKHYIYITWYHNSNSRLFTISNQISLTLLIYCVR